MKCIPFLAAAVFLTVAGCQSQSEGASSTSPSTSPAATTGFASVQPVLNKCVGCHSGAGAKEGIDMSTYASLMRGGHEGPVVIAGDPDNSLIVKALRGQAKKQMPPSGKLPDAEIQLVADWIKAGAKE